MMPFNLADLEKLVNEEDTPIDEIANKKSLVIMNDSTSVYVKTTSSQFFNQNRKKHLFMLISQYLDDIEKVSLLYLNTCTLMNLKRMIHQEKFDMLKSAIADMMNQNITIRQLLSNNADKMRRFIQVELMYKDKASVFTASKLLGKWLNKMYFEKKIPGKQNEYFELNEISLSHANLGHYGVYYLMLILENNSSLLQLDLESNNIPEDIMKVFWKALKKKEKPLAVLSFESNPIGGIRGMRYLSDSLMYLNQIKILNVSSISLNPESSLILAEGLGYLTRLETIYFDSNDIGNSAARQILKTLQNMKYLVSLSLKNTQLEKGIEKPIYDFLSICKTIKTLNLSCNFGYLDDDDANSNSDGNNDIFITKAFPNEISLSSLILEQCKMNDSEGIELFKRLSKTKTMTYLNLERNRFTMAVCKPLEKLIVATVIKTISFQGNKEPFNENGRGATFADEIKKIQQLKTKSKIIYD